MSENLPTQHPIAVGAGPRPLVADEAGARDEWLTKSRWARFGLCVAPLVAAFVLLELIALLSVQSLSDADDMGMAIWLFVAIVFLLPAALVGGLVTAAVLAVTDSRHGAGVTMLGALGGVVLGLVMPLLTGV